MKNISFDFWDTLVRSNPAYRVKVETLASEMVPEFDLVTWRTTREFIKHKYNSQIEQTNSYSIPNTRALWLELLDKVNHKHPSNVLLLDELIKECDDAFIQLPPIPIKSNWHRLVEVLETNSNVAICSNTMFTGGDVLWKFLEENTRLKRVECVFSDEFGSSKPDPKIFMELQKRGIETHFGDNVLTDGKCIEHGIRFAHVSKSFSKIKLIEPVKLLS